MKLRHHIIATLPIAAIAFGITRSWSCIIGIFIGGILIDIDHFIEFWHDREFTIDVKEFFHFGNSGLSSRLFVLFHSFKLIPLLLIGFILTNNQLFIGITLGIILHLFLDYVNLVKRFCYRWNSIIVFSFIFRLCHQFHANRIIKVIK